MTRELSPFPLVFGDFRLSSYVIRMVLNQNAGSVDVTRFRNSDGSLSDVMDEHKRCIIIQAAIWSAAVGDSTKWIHWNYQTAHAHCKKMSLVLHPDKNSVHLFDGASEWFRQNEHIRKCFAALDKNDKNCRTLLCEGCQCIEEDEHERQERERADLEWKERDRKRKQDSHKQMLRERLTHGIGVFSYNSVVECATRVLRRLSEEKNRSLSIAPIAQQMFEQRRLFAAQHYYTHRLCDAHESKRLDFFFLDCCRVLTEIIKRNSTQNISFSDFRSDSCLQCQQHNIAKAAYTTPEVMDEIWRHSTAPAEYELVRLTVSRLLTRDDDRDERIFQSGAIYELVDKKDFNSLWTEAWSFTYNGLDDLQPLLDFCERQLAELSELLFCRSDDSESDVKNKPASLNRAKSKRARSQRADDGLEQKEQKEQKQQKRCKRLRTRIPKHQVKMDSDSMNEDNDDNVDSDTKEIAGNRRLPNKSSKMRGSFNQQMISYVLFFCEVDEHEGKSQDTKLSDEDLIKAFQE